MNFVCNLYMKTHKVVFLNWVVLPFKINQQWEPVSCVYLKNCYGAVSFYIELSAILITTDPNAFPLCNILPFYSSSLICQEGIYKK